LPAAAIAEQTSSHCNNEQECTEYFMDAENLTGEFVRPDGNLYMAGRQFHQSPLIKVRNHFMNELRKSVEDI